MPWERSEAYAYITFDMYGEDKEDAVQNLVNLENAVRAHWAEKLREAAKWQSDPGKQAGMELAANALDPYSDVWNVDFGRTLIQGEATTAWPTH